MAAGRADHRLVNVVLDERIAVRRRPEVERERAVAIRDLLEENHFALKDGGEGPYILRIGLGRAVLDWDVQNAEGFSLCRLSLPLGLFRTVVTDYLTLCESYYGALRDLPRSRIEAIDVGRRALHEDGARILAERLAADIDLDFDTARRLFTLICVLHIRG